MERHTIKYDLARFNPTKLNDVDVKELNWRWSLVNMVTNLWVPHKVGNFTSSVTVSFLKNLVNRVIFKLVLSCFKIHHLSSYPII